MSMTMRRQSGISLVELMVALLLLGVALMGLAAAFAPGRMAIQSGDQATTATFLARQMIEDMRDKAYDQDADELVNGTDFPATTGYGSLRVPVVTGTLFPSYRQTITFANDSPAVGTKTATVVVFYKNSAGVEQSVTLSMIFTKGS
jgi:type II secretory pathway pseudopilin PulG